MDHMNYCCSPQLGSVETYQWKGGENLEVNVDVVVEPELCLHKQE